MKSNQYTLYVGNNCSSCNNIKQYLKDKHINIHSINIDTDKYQLPFSLMITPALVLNEKIVAYGADIINCLELK